MPKLTEPTGSDVQAVKVRVMVDHNHIVGGYVNVELAAPEAVVLGRLQGCDGILGLGGILALPKAPVGADLHPLLRPKLRNGTQQGDTNKKYSFTHISKLQIILQTAKSCGLLSG